MEQTSSRIKFDSVVQPVYLYLGFGFYLFAFVMISLYDYQQFSSSTQLLSKTIRGNDTQSYAAMHMRVSVRERAILLWQMSIEKDPFVRDELYLKFREYGGTFQKYRLVMMESQMDEQEKILMRQLDEETTKRAPMLRRFSDALMYDDSGQSFTLQLNQTLTNQIVVANILDKIIYLQTEHNTQAHKDNEERIRGYVTQLIFMVGGILLTGSLFAWMIVNSISGQRKALMEANEELHHLARYDNLTGLPNRVFLMEHLELTFSQAVRHHQLGALLFIDLDGFKSINDNYGHDMGDRFLLEIARQMQTLRDSDLVARLGGDEFVAVLSNLDSRESAYTVANKLLQRLSATYTFDDNQLKASASIGICFFPEENSSIDSLLSCADTAMYEAKRLGKNRYAIG